MECFQNRSSEASFDLIVIGGGAAGFFTAIQTAEASFAAATILILEKSDSILSKVKISGGGRCNVTHACFDPKLLSKHYPRGEKSLIGPFHHFQAKDMIEWLKHQNVELKTEADGRMFPVSDQSQTIVDSLTQAARDFKIKVKTKTEVCSLHHEGDVYRIESVDGSCFWARHLMIATGGTRLEASAKIASAFGHVLLPAVPSLFTFNIKDSRLDGIAGVSVKGAQTSLLGSNLKSMGDILVTHWGLSGPAILKLSAWGAREMAERNYFFTVLVDWSPQLAFSEVLSAQRQSYGKRSVIKRSPFEQIPRRLWEKLCLAAELCPDLTWAQLTKQEVERLDSQIHRSRFETVGKSLNKEEFVTCGGVSLNEINSKNFESKRSERIYFAGEVLDIDGITGGFNFQNAWTSAHIAAQSIAQDILSK
jgi:predicted Rossmann fold flavoprotein